MANQKITELTEDTAPTSDDLVATVTDPAGTPVNRKVTATNLITKAHGLADGVVKVASSTMAAATEGTDYYKPGGTDVAVADGGTGASTAAGAATNLGLGTGDSPQFTAVNIGHATDTTITRTGAGSIAVEGNTIYRAGGTDVPVTDGGTGASSASDARTNLGVAIGTDVQAYDADLADLATNYSRATATGPATLALLEDTDNGTNKVTVSAPSSIASDKTLTLPDATDTLVGKDTTDTLTNKTINLTSNTLSGTTAQFNTALSDDNFTTLTGSETLTNKTLTTPTIASFTNATHNHEAASGGGQLSATNIFSGGTVPTARLGSGTADGDAYLTGDQAWTRRQRLLVSENGTSIGAATTTQTSVFTSPYTFAAGELQAGDVIAGETSALLVSNTGGGDTFKADAFLGTGSGTEWVTSTLTGSASGRSIIIRYRWRIVSNTSANFFMEFLLSGPAVGTALVAADSGIVANNSAVAIPNITSNSLIVDLMCRMGTTNATQNLTAISNVVYFWPNA